VRRINFQDNKGSNMIVRYNNGLFLTLICNICYDFSVLYYRKRYPLSDPPVDTGGFVPRIVGHFL
jgi:hypothetical protein